MLLAAVKTDSQIVVVGVTHWVPLSHWHETRHIPCFQRFVANSLLKPMDSPKKYGVKNRWSELKEYRPVVSGQNQNHLGNSHLRLEF